MGLTDQSLALPERRTEPNTGITARIAGLCPGLVSLLKLRARKPCLQSRRGTARRTDLRPQLRTVGLEQARVNVVNKAKALFDPTKILMASLGAPPRGKLRSSASRIFGIFRAPSHSSSKVTIHPKSLFIQSSQGKTPRFNLSLRSCS